MPLEFHSISHGPIPFGFFHIETQLLLLHNRLLWAQDFCRILDALAETDDSLSINLTVPGWSADTPEQIGDLQAAIHGEGTGGETDILSGFYNRIPFPESAEAFRQKVVPAIPRSEAESIVDRYIERSEIVASSDPATGVLDLCELAFDNHTVLMLAEYLWRGGMPGWNQEQRPPYLEASGRRWRETHSAWFQGAEFAPQAIGLAF